MAGPVGQPRRDKKITALMYLVEDLISQLSHFGIILPTLTMSSPRPSEPLTPIR